MAGKLVASSRATAANLTVDAWTIGHRGFPDKVSRAYAEGRQNLSNPHTAGTEAYIAFDYGVTNRASADYQFECGS